MRLGMGLVPFINKSGFIGGIVYHGERWDEIMEFRSQNPGCGTAFGLAHIMKKDRSVATSFHDVDLRTKKRSIIKLRFSI